MSRLGLKTVAVYHGEACLGELEVVPVNDRQSFQFPNREIRIHRLSSSSERCPPLSVLQTISSFYVLCKLESGSSPSSSITAPSISNNSTSMPIPALIEQTPLINLHGSCFHDLKTAVMIVGEEEIHLVAMPSKLKKFPCFWCFGSPLGLYESCLTMLNLRCLAIVFDLDETLIVANTMKSFEDRIEALRSWIARETDPVRVSGMNAELKRYADDRLLLKQYTDNDSVSDVNGKVIKVQMEETTPLSESQEKLFRPVIRLQNRNIVLTRINPEIRDTSVLVRLRPAWEDLRSYLTARGRKRFEVYVCTMAERDYALEMWRLLDPESHLISSKQLPQRVVCVKPGARKSLSNVFQDGMCHPKMAMVIDDRSKVWEEKDQPRVHVVPPFTPYYAPQAEAANAVQVLCVARNVACNVRGYFFKEFDENLIRRISEIFYEDDVTTLPATPDVSNCMMSEDAGFIPNENGSAPVIDGISNADIERRLYLPDERHIEMTSEGFQQPMAFIPNVVSPYPTNIPVQRPGLLAAPVRRDLRNPPLGQLNLSKNPTAPFTSSIPLQSRSSGFSSEPDSLKSEKSWVNQNNLSHESLMSSKAISTTQSSQINNEELWRDSPKQNHPVANHVSEINASSENREIPNDCGSSGALPSTLSIEVLREIGRRCSSEIEFRSIISTGKDLQFSVEVLFTGEKVGFGMGKTKRIAQQQAAENALHYLAEKYVAYSSGIVNQNFDKLSLKNESLKNENGFVWDINDAAPQDQASGECDETFKI